MNSINNYGMVNFRAVDLRNKNAVQKPYTEDNSSNVNFKGGINTSIKTGIVSVLSALGILQYLNLQQIKSENIKNEEVHGKETEEIINEPISDFDNMGIANLNNIKIVRLPNPSIREFGYAGFVYKGNAYIAPFDYDNEISAKIGVLKELSKVDSENKDEFEIKILKLKEMLDEKQPSLDIPVSDIQNINNSYIATNLSNVKVLQLANPSLREPGAAAFVYRGISQIVGFTENTPQAIKDAVKRRINELLRMGSYGYTFN